MDNPKPKTWMVWSLETHRVQCSRCVDVCPVWTFAFLTMFSFFMFLCSTARVRYFSCFVAACDCFFTLDTTLPAARFSWGIARNYRYFTFNMALWRASFLKCWFNIRWLPSGKQTWLERPVLSRTTFYKKHFGSFPWYESNKHSL